MDVNSRSHARYKLAPKPHNFLMVGIVVSALIVSALARAYYNVHAHERVWPKAGDSILEGLGGHK